MMTVLCLSVAALILLSLTFLQMIHDQAKDRTAADLANWRAALAPARDSLLPLDFHQTWPQRLSSSDIPARIGVVISQDRPRWRPILR